MALLAEPRLGAQVVCLLEAGTLLVSEAAPHGFLRVSVDRSRGYVPLAACAPHANQSPSTVQVERSTFLQSSTASESYISLDAERWFLVPDEPLRVLGYQGCRLLVQRADTGRGVIPRTVCTAIARTERGQFTRVTEPVLLHRVPSPNGQLAWVSPAEQLTVLGRDSAYLLVQRDDGRLGFLPQEHIGTPVAGTILRLGPIDLGWITIGSGWALVNWFGIGVLIEEILPPASILRPYVLLAVVVLVVGLIAFGPRRLLGRSFAIGIILTYLFLHWISAGWLTLWR